MFKNGISQNLNYLTVWCLANQVSVSAPMYVRMQYYAHTYVHTYMHVYVFMYIFLKLYFTEKCLRCQ